MVAQPTMPAPSLVVRVSVVMCALCGAAAVALAAGPADGTPLLAAAGFAGLAGLAYPFSPRLAAYALVIMGAVALLAAVIGLQGDGAPWLLVVVWGGVALLLAGLTHFIAVGEEPAMASVTIAAVATLLVLSGLGIAQYLQLEQVDVMRQASLDGAWIDAEPLLNASARPPIAPSTSLIS